MDICESHTMEQICRVCLNTGTEMFFIFYDNSTRCGLPLSVMFQHLTGINAKAEDGLPELMCSTCIDQLEIAHAFREFCLKSDKYLKQSIADSSRKKTIKEEIPEEEDSELTIKLDSACPAELVKTEYLENDDSITIERADSEIKDRLSENKNGEQKEVKERKTGKRGRRSKKSEDINIKPRGRRRKRDPQKKTEDESENKKFLCSICGKYLALKSTLKQHMRAHQNIKPYGCSYCEMKFVSNYTRKVHERRHTNEKPFVCTQCGYRLRSSGTLLVHMRKHTGERPFLCTVENCTKAFSQSSELKVHIRSQHTGERNYKCDICVKTFITNQHLKQHNQRNHDEKREKKFACPICFNKYHLNSTVTKHLKQVHKIIRKNMF